VEVALRSAPAPGRDDVRNLSGAHPFDGARVSNILPSVADELGLEDQDGVVLLSVRANSTTAKLGFQPGDVVVQVGQERISTVVQLEGALRERQRSWLVLVRRGNQVLRLQVAG
jgi:S1-C subfamily serine protease